MRNEQLTRRHFIRFTSTGVAATAVSAFAGLAQSRAAWAQLKPAGQPDGKEAVKTDTVSYLASTLEPTKEVVYKTIDGQALNMCIFDPNGLRTGDSRPCFLVIHGGGWRRFTAERFYPFAAHFANLGLVGISINYRLLKEGSDVTVFDCVKDGRSAVRYVRSHAAELGIDPNKIVVSGGSAGGQIAACTALCQGIDDKSDETSISCMPDALVLYFPALELHGLPQSDANPGNADWKEISPLQLVRPGMPPTIIFQGTADKLAPFKVAQEFQDAMLKADNRCELVVAPGAEHGYLMGQIEIFNEGMQRTDEFLRSLGYLPK
jgi:acetyl esterase